MIWLIGSSLIWTFLWYSRKIRILKLLRYEYVYFIATMRLEDRIMFCISLLSLLSNEVCDNHRTALKPYHITESDVFSFFLRTRVEDVWKEYIEPVGIMVPKSWNPREDRKGGQILHFGWWGDFKWKKATPIGVNRLFAKTERQQLFVENLGDNDHPVIRLHLRSPPFWRCLLSR